MYCAHQNFGSCFHLFTRDLIQSIIPHAHFLLYVKVAVDFQGAALIEALIKKALDIKLYVYTTKNHQPVEMLLRTGLNSVILHTLFKIGQKR